MNSIYKKKIGLLFGTFNPIHNGHLMAANYVKENMGMDEIHFVLSPDSPFKEHNDVLLKDDVRGEIIDIACQYNRKFICNQIESCLQKPAYTYKTLNYLRKTYPNNEYHVILGADNFKDLENFKFFTDILQYHDIIVLERNDIDCLAVYKNLLRKYGSMMEKKITILDGFPKCSLSSTFIRSEVKKGHSISFYVPRTIEKMVNTLYK